MEAGPVVAAHEKIAPVACTRRQTISAIETRTSGTGQGDSICSTTYAGGYGRGHFVVEWFLCGTRADKNHAMNYEHLITIEPDKRSGKPCIRGLRITVTDVLEYLAAGMSPAEILTDFPDLTDEDIRACLAFAADRERRLQVIPTA